MTFFLFFGKIPCNRKNEGGCHIIRKILNLLFGTWFGWVLFLVILRLIVFAWGGQEKNARQQLVDALIQQLVKTQDVQIQQSAMDAMMELARFSEEIRNYIQKQTQSQLSQHPFYQTLQQRLQSDPLLILQQLYSTLRPSKQAIVTPIKICLQVLAGIALTLPALWIMLNFGTKQVYKLYYGGWYLLVVLHGTLWTSIGLEYWQGIPKEFVHILALIVLVLLFASLLQSQASTMLFGLTPQRIYKIVSITAIFLAMTCLPYVWPEEQNCPTEQAQCDAMKSVIAQHRQDLVPLIANLLPYHRQLSLPVFLQAVAVLAELGQESQVDILLQTLPTCEETEKQRAIWQAVNQILQRRS